MSICKRSTEEGKEQNMKVDCREKFVAAAVGVGKAGTSARWEKVSSSVYKFLNKSGFM